MLLMHEITEVIGADSERHRVPLLIYPYDQRCDSRYSNSDSRRWNAYVLNKAPPT